MADPAGALHIQQLVELLAVMSSFRDEASAVQGAVERAAQTLEAEVAAIVSGDRVLASVGFPADGVPHDDLIAVARRERDRLVVPGVGGCHATAAAWGGTDPGYLVLARSDEPFSVEERNLIRGMARLLELTMTMLRTLHAEHEMRQQSERQAKVNAELATSLQERQRLLQHLFNIQRAISRRRPLQQILDAVTNAAQDLLGTEMVGLWLRDPADPDVARLASDVGLATDRLERLPAVRLIDLGPAGNAMLADRLVVAHGDAAAAPLLGRLSGATAYAVLAAPVHDSGTVTGCLLVASCQPGRRYTQAEEQTLQAFAEHVSIALTDANTVDRMHQAFHDSLTGLASRALFLDRLAQQLSTAELDSSRVALLFVDLDRFKEINDTLGHEAGDRLLMITAERIKSQLRAGDVPGRLGGDEFAIMLPRVGAHGEATAVAARIVATMGEPVVVAGRRLVVGASVGIALSTPGRTDTADLMRCADIAMYQAKRNGRARYELFVEPMRASLGGLDATAGTSAAPGGFQQAEAS
jgi:diguanylate cyclase (GGDEF)-like protein